MTYFTLVVGDEGEHSVPEESREEILDWLEQDEALRHELQDIHESGMSSHTAWYEHDRDMLRLSKAFPVVHFVLCVQPYRSDVPISSVKCV